MATVPQKEILRRTIQSLESSCRAHPDNAKLAQQLAQAYYKAGHFHPRAIKLYDAVSEIFPADVWIQRAVAIGYMINQGRALVQDTESLEELDAERLDKSIEQMRALSRTYGDSPDILRSLGELLLIRGDYRAALQSFRSAIALGLEDLAPLCAHYERMADLVELPPSVSSFFAELYQRVGRHQDAANLYRRLVADGEADAAAIDAYYAFLLRRNEAVRADPRALEENIRQLSETALLKGSASEALTWSAQLSPEAVGRSATLSKRLARLLIDREDYRQAFDYLRQIPLDSEAKALINEMTVRMEKRGELDTAAYLLRFINEHDLQTGSSSGATTHESRPATVDVELEIQGEREMAALHMRSRRFQEAFNCYLRMLELGYADYKSLLEPMDLALQEIPDVHEGQLAFLANFFAERRDWRRTLYYAERALHLDPTLEDIRQRLIQACEQILLQDPEDCAVRLKLGDMQLERGNIERAMKEFRRVAANQEFGMKANRRMALALSRAGDLKSALQKFQELPLLQSEDLEHLYDLMMSFQAGEQWKPALEAAALIRENDSGFRDIEGYIAFIEEQIAGAGAEAGVDPKMRELIGDHSMGRYKYIDKIGSGGMGVVHKVLDLKTNQTVAMKILREGLSGSDKAIDRFFREARIAATLHHPNIVNIIDYNISNTYGQSYIAMEFVDGPSLRDIVEERFANTVDLDLEYILRVCEWMIQTCSALEATHRKGIIHRDIKPDNIMVATAGNQVKLTDFGIVHIEEATFTPTGALIGTPRYMSPEQVHGGRIDARSDLYSVGIIFYEMLIGSPPFISGDISYQQVNVIPTTPAEICPAVPQALDAVIMRCLEKTPSARYQSAAELRAVLEEAFVHVGGNPERLSPSGTSEARADRPLVRPSSTAVDASSPLHSAIVRAARGERAVHTTNDGEWGTETADSAIDEDLMLDSGFELDSEFELPRDAHPLPPADPPPPSEGLALDDLDLDFAEPAGDAGDFRRLPPPAPPSVDSFDDLDDLSDLEGLDIPAADAPTAPPLELDSLDDLDDLDGLEDIDAPVDSSARPATPPASSGPRGWRSPNAHALDDLGEFDF